MTIYYAAQSPRGFANEVDIHAFSTKAKRDAWVDEHADDGDVNSATMGAYAVTQKEARKIVGYSLDSQDAAAMIGEIDASV